MDFSLKTNYILKLIRLMISNLRAYVSCINRKMVFELMAIYINQEVVKLRSRHPLDAWSLKVYPSKRSGKIIGCGQILQIILSKCRRASMNT